MKARPLTRETLRKHPLPPVVDGDKETKGRLLVVAGSREVPGAALLSATAAMRAGAGKLKIATGSSIAPQIGVAMPEAMVVGLAEDRGGGFTKTAADRLGQLALEADAIVAGPGLASNGQSAAIAARLMKSDAALALDAALLHDLQPPDSRRPSLPLLLPHAGEMASLLDCDEERVERDPLGCGLDAARTFEAIVLVKGVVSHVVEPGGDAWVYEGGAPGLGVSGSGDVLAGVAGGLLSRGARPLEALLWAVWLHGEAGASLARRVAPIGFLAREIAGEIPALLPS